MNFSAVPDTWPAIALAFAMTLLAGLSTGLGGLIVALKTRPSEAFLAGSLGLSAGVMIYISLVELLPQGIADLAAAGNPARRGVGGGGLLRRHCAYRHY